MLPNLEHPVGSYPALAAKVLPAGLLGLFALALLATVMSTVDSYAFLAASTFGNDIIPRLKRFAGADITRYTRIGLIVSVVLAVVLALFFQSVVDVWYVFGSIGTPALLVPVFTSLVGKRRLTAAAARWSIVLCGSASFLWYLSKYVTDGGDYLWGVQPIFPGLVLSLLIFAAWSRQSTALATPLDSRPSRKGG